MKKLQNFIDYYKDILAMKKSYNGDIGKKQLALKTLSLTFIMVVTSIITAMLFNTIENLGYLFTIVNGVILGSFIIYKTLVEIKIRTQIKEDYDILLFVVFESLELLIMLLLLTVTLFVTILINLISYFVLISYVVLLVITMLFRAAVEVKLKDSKYYITSSIQIIKGSIYLGVLFLVLAYSVSLPLNIGIIVIYTVLVLMYLYKLVFHDYLGYFYRRSVYGLLGVVVLVIIGYPLFINSTQLQDTNPVDIELELLDIPDLGNYIDSITTLTQRVYLSQETIVFYDHEYHLEKILDNEGFTELYVWGNRIFVSTTSDTDKYYCKSKVFYELEGDSFTYHSNEFTYTNRDLYLIDNQIVGFNGTDLHTIDENCYSHSVGDSYVEGETGIISQTEDYLILKKFGDIVILDNEYDYYGQNQTYYKGVFLLYSDGYILTFIDEEGRLISDLEKSPVVMTVHDFLQHDIYTSGYTKLDFKDFDSIETFNRTKDLFVIEVLYIAENVYKHVNYIYDHDFRLLHTYDGSISNITYSNYSEFLYLGDLSNLVFNSSNLALKTFSLVSIIVLLFTMMPLPFLKGGEAE